LAVETSPSTGNDFPSPGDPTCGVDPEVAEGSKFVVVRSPGWRKLNRCLVVNPDESAMFYWLTVTALSVLYNLWTCIAREAFPEFQSWSDTGWFIADVMCDVI